jgi:CDP-glucose 4,6-dehydratase
MEKLVNQAAHSFWRHKRVLVTGHTGFKGAWLSKVLLHLGAQVSGLALAPAAQSAFSLMQLHSELASHQEVDIRVDQALAQAVHQAQPEVVFHLAAQALVGDGFRDPAGTFATNVHGSVNLMQALRGLSQVQAVVMVTSDKVYRNDNSGRPFKESDPLGGHDPYSASKAAAEIAIDSWRHSFGRSLPPMVTVRAGNVVGGGDFGRERLIPDLVRAQQAGQSLSIRNPHATRPFQHVLDVLHAYLLSAQALATAPTAMPTALNIGPQAADIRVMDLLDHWQEATGEALRWTCNTREDMPEQQRLALDSSLARRTLGWQPAWNTAQAITHTARWYQSWRAGEDMSAHSAHAIADYFGK